MRSDRKDHIIAERSRDCPGQTVVLAIANNHIAAPLAAMFKRDGFAGQAGG